MFSLIQKGGPIMWPLIVTSVVSLAVVIERLWFILDIKLKRNPRVIEGIMGYVDRGRIEEAVETGEGSQDFVARVLVYGLKYRQESLPEALLKAANQEMKAFNQGLNILDTVVTLAPLLGLLSTVIGMIHAFGLLGGKELDAPSVITGGIAEALIGTAFGLGIAILALIPFNYLMGYMEKARHEIEDAASALELALKRRQS